MATVVQTLDIGRVVTRGFDVLIRNAGAFLLVSIVLAGIPTYAMQYWLYSSALSVPADPNVIFTAMFWMPFLLSTLVSIVTSALLQAILIRSAILHLSGRPADVGGSIAASAGLILPIIGLSILLGVIVMFGLILLIVPGVIFYLMFIVAAPALVGERCGVIESLSRSAALTSGSRLMIFLMVVAFIIFSWIFGAATGAISGVSVMVTGTNELGLPGAGALALTGAVQGTITTLIAAAMVAALYIELRTIKEGATTDGLAEVFA